MLMPVARSSALLAAGSLAAIDSPRLKAPPTLTLRLSDHPEPDEGPDWLQHKPPCRP